MERISNTNSEVPYLNERKLDNLIRLRTRLFVFKEFPFTKPLAVALITDLEEKIFRLECQYLDVDFFSSLSLQKNHLAKRLNTNKELRISETIREWLGK